MTILIFVGALLGAMALGVPIAFALLLSGVALMLHLDLFERRSWRRTSSTAPTASRCWPCPSSCWPARS